MYSEQLVDVEFINQDMADRAVDGGVGPLGCDMQLPVALTITATP